MAWTELGKMNYYIIPLGVIILNMFDRFNISYCL